MSEELPDENAPDTSGQAFSKFSDKSAYASWRLPVSFYIWSFLLFLTFLLPWLSPVKGPVATRSGLSTADFQKLTTAELSIRSALAPSFLPDAGKQMKRQKGSSVKEVTQTYRELATEAYGVSSARRFLILNHLQGKPLDEPFLTGTLAGDLQRRGEKPGEITSEIALWRTLYGNEGPFDKSDTDDLARRIRALKIGFLQDQALVDLYTLAGRKADARAAKNHLQATALHFTVRLLLLYGLLGIGFLLGMVFLLLFSSAWQGRQWNIVARLRKPEADRPLPGGELLDVFVAYLTLVRGLGILISFIPGIAEVSPVLLAGGVYVGSGLIATGYLRGMAQLGNWSLPSLGLRLPNGLLPNFFYGIAGYCATLPLTLALGMVNEKLLHRNNNSLTPNPILPLIAGEGSLMGRVLLFFLVSIAAPFFEELFFRGVLYTALRTRYRAPVAIVISAACFAVVHPTSDWLPIFGLGCVLATVREMRQSLFPGMIVHFCQNSSAFLMMSIVFGR